MNKSKFSSQITANLMSGLSVFLVALPLSLGIAMAARMPASTGILSAIIGGLLGGFFSGTNIGISGPAAGLIVVMINAITTLALEGDYYLGMQRVFACLIVVGLLQVFSGFLRLGRFVFLCPHTVVSGMLAGIGVIILVKQTPIVMGVLENPYPKIGDMLIHLSYYFSNTNLAPLSIGLVSLILVFGWKHFPSKLTSKFPAALVCVIAGLIMVQLFSQNESYLKTISLVQIPTALSQMFISPKFDLIFSLPSLMAIFSLYFVCSLESLISTYAVDQLDPLKRKSSLNKDLINKGLINLTCGMLGAYPVITEIVRSKANADNGATNKLSNFFHGVFLLLSILLLAPIINQIPLSALAAVLIFVGFNLAHPRQLKAIYQHGGKTEILIFLTTLMVTVFVDLLYGIALGIALSFTFDLIRGSRIKDFFSMDYHIQKNGEKEITLHIHSCLNFTNFLQIKSLLKNVPETTLVHFVFDHNAFADNTIEDLIDHDKHPHTIETLPHPKDVIQLPVTNASQIKKDKSA